MLDEIAHYEAQLEEETAFFSYCDDAAHIIRAAIEKYNHNTSLIHRGDLPTERRQHAEVARIDALDHVARFLRVTLESAGLTLDAAHTVAQVARASLLSEEVQGAVAINQPPAFVPAPPIGVDEPAF